MSRYNFEFKLTRDDHVPLVVQTEGIDLESLLADAEWCIDMPDPKKFYGAEELPGNLFEVLQARLAEEIASQDEFESEAREVRP